MAKFQADIRIKIDLEAENELEADLMLIDRIAPSVSVEDEEFKIISITVDISEIKYESQENKQNGFPSR